MAETSFTKAEIERVLAAARSSGTQIHEIRVEKTLNGTVIRAFFGASNVNEAPLENDPELPKAW